MAAGPFQTGDAMRARLLLLLFLLLAPGLPAGSRCSPKLDGQLWPKEANSDPREAKAALACGVLEMCQRVDWRHRWEQVGVPYWQLAGEQAPERCKPYLEALKQRDTGKDRKNATAQP